MFTVRLKDEKWTDGWMKSRMERGEAEEENRESYPPLNDMTVLLFPF